MVFSRTMIATDRETLSTFYEDKTYADANVLPLTKIDLDHHTIDLTFEIERGYASTFERIDVIAKSRARADAIRRVVTVAAGQPYSETGLVETKRRLGQLGYDVAISRKHGSTDALVVATIEELQ
jgi:outer membrane protein insertion porin family